MERSTRMPQDRANATSAMRELVGVAGPLRVAALRRAKKLTQSQLADATGLSQPTISDIERGKHNPELSNLLRIADALDVQVYELFSSYERSDLVARIETIDRMLDDEGREQLLRIVNAIVADRL